MYYQITFRWTNKCRKITLPSIKDKQNLTNLLKQLFRLQDEQIVGLSDKNGRFYDFERFSTNLQAFNNQTVELITSKIMNNQQEQFPNIDDQNDINIEPISFASNTPNEFQNDYNPFNEDSQLEERFQLPEESDNEVIAQIHDLKLFEETILDDDVTIVIESNKKIDQLDINYYHLKGKQQKVYVYKTQKKICQIPIFDENWKQTENIIFNIIQSLQSNHKLQSKSYKASSETNYPFEEPPFDSIPIYKVLNPIQQKKSSSKGQSKQTSKRNKGAFQKQKNGQQKIYNLFPQKKESKIERAAEQQRYEIPIIIRKSNNKIQKVNASYPLSPQQMKAINSLLQLEIQGLFTDEEINKVKMMVLGENDSILRLFSDYSKQKMNVGELYNSLKPILKRKNSLKK